MELTTEQIKEGNEKIAKFLGWGDNATTYISYSIINDHPHNDLPFHRDWNYLMKVVDKIGCAVYHREGDEPDYNWKNHYSYSELFAHIWNREMRLKRAKSGEFNLMNNIESIWSSCVAVIIS